MIKPIQTEVRLNITLHKNQQFIQDTARRFNVIKCGKRFGKSYLAMYRAIRKASQCAGGVVWYIAPTYGQAKDIAWNTIQWMCPTQIFTASNRNELTKTLWNGCHLVLKGADNPETLRGPKLNHAVFDEADYFQNGLYVWNSIVRGQLMGGGTCDFISSPRGQGRAWFGDFWNEAKRKEDSGDPEWKAYKFTIYDNPTLSPVEIEQMKASMSGDAWDLEYMAIESASAGLRFKEFNYDRHTGEGCGGVIVRSIDWGISHPTVCLWAKVDVENEQVYVYDEYSKSGMLIKESCEIIKQKTGKDPVEWTTIDPSTRKRDGQTGRRDMDEFMRWGIPVIAGDNQDSGYDTTNMFFKLDKIKINKRCKGLISELRNLQYGEDVNDDHTDCLRYLLKRVHDIMFRGKFSKTPEQPQGYNKFKDPVYMKERMECNINNKFMFPDPMPNNMNWIMEEAMVD